MASSLSVPHSRQIEEGYCLPACVQMALAHLGISRSQQEIGRALQIRRGFGVPASHILRLRGSSVSVAYHVDGTLGDLRNWLDTGVPVIAFVQAGELPHWAGVHAQHAILVAGLTIESVLLHDPALRQGPTVVSLGDFLLAWDEMEHRYAVISSGIHRSAGK